MKEKPILFNGEMVRAVLDGQKTQTRRVWRKPKRHAFNDVHPVRAAGRFELTSGGFCIGETIHCPYGLPGNTLWVRETWNSDQQYVDRKPSEIPVGAPIYYRADVGDPAPDGVRFIWRPSIHMPRWASRITLRVKSVRVERVQDISEKDIYAEGAISNEWLDWREDAQSIGLPPGSYIERERDVFTALWDSINARRGFSWSSNPWVWVVEFQKVE